MLRITNRLRALKAREKKYISEQTYASPVAKVTPNFQPSGPYRRWVPTNDTTRLIRRLEAQGIRRDGDTLYAPNGVGVRMTDEMIADL